MVVFHKKSYMKGKFATVIATVYTLLISQKTFKNLSYNIVCKIFELLFNPGASLIESVMTLYNILIAESLFFLNRLQKPTYIEISSCIRRTAYESQVTEGALLKLIKITIFLVQQH